MVMRVLIVAWLVAGCAHNGPVRVLACDGTPGSCVPRDLDEARIARVRAERDRRRAAGEPDACDPAARRPGPIGGSTYFDGARCTDDATRCGGHGCTAWASWDDCLAIRWICRKE